MLFVSAVIQSCYSNLFVLKCLSKIHISSFQGNYVPREDIAVGSGDSPQFDLILCLSTTKWLHLNWGDAGLKRAFRRMFADLRPGGKLVLEAQNWASYKKKKRLTVGILETKNFQNGLVFLIAGQSQTLENLYEKGNIV